ncbi:MAG: hypothetical protein IIA08_04275 [Proteobacteria bacterium]|nr:hypothetical protein [Pseudomonadota bacterium]
MKFTSLKAVLVTAALCASGAANADFGVGIKAGTLGVGFEGRWSPIPWFDIRAGLNKLDYERNGTQSGIDYDATLVLDTYFLTANFKFPLSPFRVTVGAFSNGNEFQMVSQDTGGIDFDIGGIPFGPDDVGVLQSTTSFDKTAPYFGFGFDFEVFGKVGLNLDLGVLWQGDPIVTLEATGLDNVVPQALQDELRTAIEIERQQLEDEMSDFKAWPVISLGFVYNF